MFFFFLARGLQTAFFSGMLGILSFQNFATFEKTQFLKVLGHFLLPACKQQQATLQQMLDFALVDLASPAETLESPVPFASLLRSALGL